VGIRENLNKSPAITTGATIAIIVIALGFIVYQLLPNRGPRISTKVFFTDDDGQTYFSEEGTVLPPFDHSGKEAVRCYVYSCGGTKFVGYLEKYTDDAKSKLDAASKSNTPNPMMMEDMEMMQGRLVKKPGDAKWIKSSDFEKAQKVMEIHCPDGSSGELTPILP
jgi:hypothetical protein